MLRVGVPSVMARSVDHREAHTFTSSTRVDRAWYDPETQVLELLFPDGVRWRYEGILPATWARFKRSPSPGRFVAEILDRYPSHPA